MCWGVSGQGGFQVDESTVLPVTRPFTVLPIQLLSVTVWCSRKDTPLSLCSSGSQTTFSKESFETLCMAWMTPRCSDWRSRDIKVLSVSARSQGRAPLSCQFLAATLNGSFLHPNCEMVPRRSPATEPFSSAIHHETCSRSSAHGAMEPGRDSHLSTETTGPETG